MFEDLLKLNLEFTTPIPYYVQIIDGKAVTVYDTATLTTFFYSGMNPFNPYIPIYDESDDGDIPVAQLINDYYAAMPENTIRKVVVADSGTFTFYFYELCKQGTNRYKNEITFLRTFIAGGRPK